jgi:heptosyltransferase III
MAKLLFITSHRIGDAVLSTGVLEFERQKLGMPDVTIVCGDGPQALFRATPGLIRLETMIKQPGRWRKLWQSLRGDSYDVALDLRGSLVTYGLRVRRRVVYRRSSVVQHKVEELGALVGAEPPPAPKIHLDQKARHDVEALLGPAVPSLLLGPGAHFIGKRWPPENYIDLASRLVGTGGPLAGLPVVLLGGPGDEEVATSIGVALAARQISTVNAAGRLDLLASAAAMERAVMFIGNDSGLMHMAAAMGAPTLGLFGPSPERIYGPWGGRTRTIRGPITYEQHMAAAHMPDVRETLMGDLTVDAVETAAREMLDRGGLA